MKFLSSTLLLLLFLIPASAQQPATATKPAPTTQRAPAAAAKHKLAGRVIDDTGRPVSDASLLAMPTGKTDSMQQVLMNYRTASTDEQGKFEIDNLAPGAYRLLAAAPGYVLAQDSAEEGGRPKLFRTNEAATLRLVKGAVITGTVIDAAGEPVVAVRVRAHRIKDEKGRPAVVRVSLNETTLTNEWKTDDRGVYRIYGLEPGTYVISAGGKGLNPMSIGAFDADAPSYHPSGTRDTAAPVTVQAGQEATGIDIRWREAKGFVVSGKIINPEAKGGAVNVVMVTLTNAATGNLEGLALSGLMPGGQGGGSSFALTGVGDGEYRVTATAVSDSMERAGNESMLVSPAHRVVVKGADVTGLELTLASLGSISGQFVLEKMKSADNSTACQPKRAATIEEAVIAARSDAKKKEKTDRPVINFSPFGYSTDGVPDLQGNFRILIMETGRYRFDIKLPSEDWYLQSITLTREETAPAGKEAKPRAQAAANPSRDLIARGLPVKMSERVTGVRIVAAEGAAAIKGQVKTEKESEPLPGPVQVFLVPAEPEHADNLLRFYQADLEKDNTFSIGNIAPGRYLVLLRDVSEEEANDIDHRPLAWNDEARVTLRLKALSANHILELTSCQRLANYTLKYAPVKKKGS